MGFVFYLADVKLPLIVNRTSLVCRRLINLAYFNAFVHGRCVRERARLVRWRMNVGFMT